MSWIPRDGRARTIKPTVLNNNADGYLTSATYAVGRYNITVPVVPNPNGHSEAEDITVCEAYDARSRDALASLEVVDGQIRVALSDLADLVVQRAAPVDLVAGLLANDDVREAMVEAFANRYNDSNIGAAERRKFLELVHEELRSTAVHKLASEIAAAEYGRRRDYSTAITVRDINDRLRNMGIADPWAREPGTLLQFRETGYAADEQIGGLHWNKATEYWRERVEARFPTVTVNAGVDLPPELRDATRGEIAECAAWLTERRAHAAYLEARRDAELTPPAPEPMPEPKPAPEPSATKAWGASFDDIPF